MHEWRDTLRSLCSEAARATEAVCLFEADTCQRRLSTAAVLGQASADRTASAGALAALRSASAVFVAWLAASDAAGAATSARPPTGARLDEEAHLEDAVVALRALHDQAWHHLHAGAKVVAAAAGDVEAAFAVRPWREVFALCCLLRCVVTAARLLRPPAAVVKDGGAKEPVVAELPEGATELQRMADLGLIIGGPESHAAARLFELADRIAGSTAAVATATAVAEVTAAAQSTKRRRCSTDGKRAVLPLVRLRAALPQLRRPIQEVPRGQHLSLEDFLLHHLGKNVPVVFRGACDGWPAITSWADASYWQTGALGRRLVPVELDYWFERGFELMPLRDFAGHLLEVEDRSDGEAAAAGLSGGGYLAQHPLLDQVPSLEADVLTPDLVHSGPEGHLLRLIFFGPRGTVTPLHYDPYENALCQVVGEKYLRLYAHSEGSKLCPRDCKDALRNNSTVEPADILEGEATGAYIGRFDEFLKADFLEVVLRAGDLLYLPSGWWHFVKSMSTSISLAYHFR